MAPCPPVWLGWAMRVESRGNLTVQLIRISRFAVDSCQPHEPQPHRCADHHRPGPDRGHACRADQVRLSPEALASDPWATPADRQTAAYSPATLPPLAEPAPAIAPEPQPLTPVVGSPALAGLGVSLIVPGTLLDVVA